MDLEIINIGIVGHIDHGKTTLLKKLSGKWTDTHSEELKRGITIKLGYADTIIYNDKGSYNIEKKGEPIRKVSFVDAPGHEMLMATMLSGAAMIDAAILVVAANEGIKPQTREHLRALKAKKVENLIVAQNKIDLVTQEQAEKNHKEILELLDPGFQNSPIIPISAQQGVNVPALLKAICDLTIPDRKPDADPVFIVARSFDINKPGTTPKNLKGAVLGGTLKQGKLKIGDSIEIKPGRNIGNQKYETIKTKINNLFRGSEELSELTPGGSTSIETDLDMAQGKSDFLAGNVTSREGILPETQNSVTIKYTLFPEVFGARENIKIEPIKPSEILMLSVNTTPTGGAVTKVDKDTATIDLRIPIVPSKGDNVGIAREIQKRWRLIGYGEII